MTASLLGSSVHLTDEETEAIEADGPRPHGPSLAEPSVAPTPPESSTHALNYH